MLISSHSKYWSPRWAGANVNERRFDGTAPLHDAVRAGSPGALKLLLFFSADPTATDDAGRRPLDLAAVGTEKPLDNARMKFGRAITSHPERRAEMAMMLRMAKDLAVAHGESEFVAQWKRHFQAVNEANMAARKRGQSEAEAAAQGRGESDGSLGECGPQVEVEPNAPWC